MNDKPVFVDTNILIYAHDKDAGDKYRAAKTAKARELWSEDLNPGQNYEGVVVINPLARK
jgi:predicted nucleic acid-binding protein